MDKRYNKCFVPGCPLTSNRFPNKKFLYISKNDRKKWFETVGRVDLNTYSPSTKIYICEDHYRNPQLNIKIKNTIKTEDTLSPTPHSNTAKRNSTTALTDVSTSVAKVFRSPVIPKVGAASNFVPIPRPNPVNQTVLLSTSSKSKIVIENNRVRVQPQTAFKIETKDGVPIPLLANGSNAKFVERPTFWLKHHRNKSIRNITIELIENSPLLHLGLTADRLDILKTIVCFTAKVNLVDLYITLKKLRTNESFALLGEYFEYSEDEVLNIFTLTILRLAKYLKFLIRWPEGKKYYDRHKNLPIAFRSKLSYVQSLVDCVETEVRTPLYPAVDVECKTFKFILTVAPTGVISYISEAFVGNHDDLTIFKASNFRSIIPKHLSLVAEPGESIRDIKATPDSDSTTDSADENDDSFKQKRPINNTMNIVNSQIKSLKVKDFNIPTFRVNEPVCRQQIRNLVDSLREFKILQSYSVLEPHLYQYINEILVIVSALTNLQR